MCTLFFIYQNLNNNLISMKGISEKEKIAKLERLIVKLKNEFAESEQMIKEAGTETYKEYWKGCASTLHDVIRRIEILLEG